MDNMGETFKEIQLMVSSNHYISLLECDPAPVIIGL